MLGGDFKVRTIQAYFIMENMVQQANDASFGISNTLSTFSNVNVGLPQ